MCFSSKNLVFLHPKWFEILLLLFLSSLCNLPFFFLSSPGRPIAHQPPPDAHKLLSVCHGHHNVLLRSHQGPARESTANQRGLLPWEGTTTDDTSTQWVRVVRLLPVLTAKATASVAGGAVRGLASWSPRAVSELWHGLMDKREGEKYKPVAYWTLGIQ